MEGKRDQFMVIKEDQLQLSSLCMEHEVYGTVLQRTSLF